MRQIIRSLGAVAMIALATLSWGCDNNPSAPSVLVTVVSPSTGSTVGGTRVNVSGTGLPQGSTVTFGGMSAAVISVQSTYIGVMTPAHVAGTVDVVVTTPSGSSITAPGAYTYVAGPPLIVSAISPNVGSTAGGFPLLITGSGFQAGARVTLGAAQLATFVLGSTTIISTGSTPAHAPGAVDVVVSNGDGQSATVTNGFTYAPPESFDPNGIWEGEIPEEGSGVRITIQNNLVTSVSCGTSAVFTFVPPTVVSGGAFSASRDDGVSVSGRIVAPSIATGSVRIPGCPEVPWVVRKK